MEGTEKEQVQPLGKELYSPQVSDLVAVNSLTKYRAI